MYSEKNKHFFFYNNFKNDVFIKKISENYITKDAYVLVNDYNLNINYVKINNNNNTKKLKGKLVLFPFLENKEIINRIIKIFSNNKKKIKNYNFCLKDILTITKKYNWFNRVLNFIKIENIFYKERYRIFVIKCFVDGDIKYVNIII